MKEENGKSCEKSKENTEKEKLIQENKKEGKTEQGKRGKRYSIRDNYRVAFMWMREIEGTGYFFYQGAHVALAVIQPFLTMTLPGAVVYLLGSGWEPGRIFFALAGYVFVLQGIQVAAGYLEACCKKKHMSMRLRLGEQYFGASMDVNYQELESEAGQKKLKDAMMNIYYGNERGVEAFFKALERFLINLLGLILYSVVIGGQSMGILALSFLTAGAAAGIHAYAHKRAVKYDEKYEKAWQDYNRLGGEVLASANGKDIRLYHMWSWIAEEFERLKEDFIHWGYRHWKCCRGNAEAAEKCLAFVRDLLVYGYLINQMIQGRMELSAFLVYIGVVSGFGGWMTPLLDALTAILENGKCMDKYRVFLEFAEEGVRRTVGGALPEGGASEDYEAFKRQEPLDACGKKEAFRPAVQSGQTHEIRLEHVSFRYEGNREDTIRDLSLTIASGEKVALVGMNGAGKTTLVKLICGLYRPSSGRIYLDGKDISGISTKDYYKEFAVVFQDVFAFSFPLEDNVSCKDGTAVERERLKTGLQKAGLWEKVQTLEKKEQTYLNRDIDPSGVELSGGELQRLMLARALYKDAPVLILDEPTAALDPIAESGLYGRYCEMTREKTSIFISHRLSSTKFCDRILFMENGRITEEGGHEELLARQGAYAAMFHTQAQYYQTENEAQK